MLIKEIESQSQSQNTIQAEDLDDVEDDESVEDEVDEEKVDEINIKKAPQKSKNRTDSVEEDSLPDAADGKRHGDDENIETSAEITAGVGSKRIKKKQKQDYVVTAASEQDLTAMFSPSGLLLSTDWDTIKDPVMREFKLEGFGYSKNNTIALKLTVPPGSTRWSFNICPPDHVDSTNILLHFNPRKGKKTELVMNDKQGTWGM